MKMKKITTIFSLCWLLATGVFQGQTTNQGPLDPNGATYYDQLDKNGNAPGELNKSQPVGVYTYDHTNAYTHLIPYLKNRASDEETLKLLQIYLLYKKNNSNFDSGPDCQTCIRVKIPKSVVRDGSFYEEKERSFFKDNVSSLLSINNFFQERTLLGALGLQLIDAYFDTNLQKDQMNQITMVFFYNPYQGQLRLGKGILLRYSYPFTLTKTQGEYVNLKLDFPFGEKSPGSDQFNLYSLDNQPSLMIQNVNLNNKLYNSPDVNSEIRYSSLFSLFGRYLVAANNLGTSVSGLVKTQNFTSELINDMVKTINDNNQNNLPTTTSDMDLLVLGYIFNPENVEEVKNTYNEIISFILRQMSTNHPVFLTNKNSTILK